MARFHKDGITISKHPFFAEPLYFHCHDGERYNIKITDVHPCQIEKKSRPGVRYEIVAGGRTNYLYLDGELWYFDRE